MKFTSKYVCQQCGYASGGWLGRCPQCDSWNSMVEEVVQTGKGAETQLFPDQTVKDLKPLRLDQIKTFKIKRILTGVEEFDRVLGGGIVPGSIVLVAGEPGVGKSTLLSRVFAKLKVLYISGEESEQQIKIRMERLGIKENFLLATETNVESIVGYVRGIKKNNKNTDTFFPDVLVIDSIQTLYSNDLRSSIGSVGQVKECTNKLLNLGKSENLPIFIIGHVTKEGVIAGPKVLEHMVDTVLSLEGERYQSLRILRANKNRFGPTDEVGVFQMDTAGLREVTNPSEIFLNEKENKVSKAGSIITCSLEGTRPILAEIQALVVSTQIPIPRRVVSGVDYNRVQLIIAVLQKYLSLPLYSSDIYVSVSGGLKISEPAADLAIALCIWSSFKNTPLQARLVAFGEIGLLGEIREVTNREKREKEARKLGFKNISKGENIKEVINKL